MVQRTEIHTGMLVRSRVGERLGHVIGLSEEGVLVEKGLLRPHDHRASLGELSQQGRVMPPARQQSSPPGAGGT